MGLPGQLTAVLEEVLGAEPDDQALAIIGFGQLHHCDPVWVTDHADALLPLDPAWRPARSWLTHGRPDPALLARLDRAGLWQALCAPHAESALDRVFLALLDEAELLGPAGAFIAGLAGCMGGDKAVSVMLSRLATYTARAESDEVAEGVSVVWGAALDAGLPTAALHGVGHFAFADSLAQDTWLELTAAALTQQPDLEDADHVAERAARTPAAQLIATAGLDHGSAWDTGASLEAVEADAVAWLRDLVTGWSTPRLGTSSPLGAATTAPGGSAPLSLTAWGVQSAERTAGGLPQELTVTLEALLGAEPADDQALAVIGFCLTLLHRCDPTWTADHIDTLLPLEPAWRPARVWLTHGKPDAALLPRLDHTGLWRVLCAPDAEGSLCRVFLPLLDNAEPLGPAAEFLAGLAGCAGGAVAVSAMLSQLATYTARSESGEVTERAAGLWRTALGAGLPAAALRGVGHFVFAACLDQDLWLELTVATLTQQPDLEEADYLVKRAARTPASPGAQFIAAAALGHGPANGYRARTVRRAADLYAAAPAENTPERAALRVALINAGAIDDAYGS
ncbi:hypothetical protein M2271_008056 [Streptomyces sp. LBL]|uniref:hypothetical protein n=1 Tax=Streptomyces sp. LBL TaxID=2940562 RepID=UPI002475B09B|nr:hypothetical protein [Streptomyces sp. LBL]MDH6630202.1 hypothetical protein [Streptomyces sp. LBL]